MKYGFLIATIFLLSISGEALLAQSSSSQDTNQTEDNVYTSREVTRKAKITYKPEPAYTEEARNHHVRGTVILTMVLRASGMVTDITVVKGLALWIDGRMY